MREFRIAVEEFQNECGGIKKSHHAGGSLVDDLLLGPHGTKAIAAIHGPIAAGDERNFSIDATLGAHYRMHLPRSAGETALLVLASSTTLRATFRLVGVTPGCEELLLSHRKGECCAAVHANSVFVCQCHSNGLHKVRLGSV